MPQGNGYEKIVTTVYGSGLMAKLTIAVIAETTVRSSWGSPYVARVTPLELDLLSSDSYCHETSMGTHIACGSIVRICMRNRDTMLPCHLIIFKHFCDSFFITTRCKVSVIVMQVVINNKKSH